jgi:hypothetical protein
VSDLTGHMYAVGQPYVAGKRNWPEWAEYNYRHGHELRLFYRNPSPAEVAAVQSGTAHFAIYPLHDLIFFCFRFAPMGWSDSGFTIHLVNEEDRGMPDDFQTPEERQLINTILVDASTGLIRAIRVCTFSPAFTRALHAAIWAQLEKPFCGRDEIERQGQSIYSRYSSADIATKLAIVKCRGGE